MKSWSHIWLMLNKLTLKPSTYNAFAMSDNLGREIVPFYLRFAPITESDISTFLKLQNLEERTVSSHVSWAPIIKVPQTCVHYLKCRLHHKAHFMLAWQIHRNGFFIYHLCTKSLIFTLLKWTPLHILILRQSIFFLVTLRPFSTINKIAFK